MNIIYLKRNLTVFIALVAVILCGCTERTNTTETVSNNDTDEILYQITSESTQSNQTASTTNDTEIYDNLLTSMTTEEKVGQLFFIRPEQLIPDRC